MGLGALLLLLTATTVGAQTVSPGSITRDPSATCGGGSESVGDVCITLPEKATCETVDVFLLFDDTGSFQENVAKTGKEFQKIVDRLQDEFPGVSFAFGVGRFEEYGGLGRTFSDTPAFLEDRPFILNQALLETTHPEFTRLLELALGDPTTMKDVREAPGFGGDTPETAIEALFQAATGLGFDGDGNGSVLDSGPAGALATQLMPRSSGDVPSFSSYQGEHSGTLGGVGWRASSCERLVLLSTDACAVAPFERPDLPETVSGSGAEVPASFFDCGPFEFADRFGFPGLGKSPTAGETDAVAPQGAATVQDTVDALNDLGIRVIGLGTGTPPSDLSGPSTDEYVFLAALAELTGAVDSNGDPLVFDLGTDSQELQDSIVEAVAQSLDAPIGIALVPDPALPGLTVTATPPIQEDVRPGETVCYSVSFEGDEGFEGGSFGLDFVDTASNGSLGMRVPVNLRCPDCFDLFTRSLLCEADESGFTGSFEWTFILRNRSDDDIHHLFFVDLPEGVTIEPQHLTFSPPVKTNQPRLVTVRIEGEGAKPGTPLDFRITLHDAAIDQCCAEEVRIELPECDCAQLRVDRNPSCFRPPFTFSPGPPWRYTFDLENLTTVPVDYLLLSPVSTTDHLTPVPPSELVIDPDVLLLESTLGVGDETGLIPVELSGPAARQGEEACFRISTHDDSFRQCCSIVKCFTFPDCSFGAVDFESLGGATLTRSGTALIVTDIGSSGEDGVAADFGPAGEVEISLQDFSAGVPLPEGAFVRLGGLGTVEGEEVEVSNVVATLAKGQVHVLPGRGAPSLRKVLVLREGEVVATCEESGTVAAVDGDWPTGFVMEENLAGIADQSPQLRLKGVMVDDIAGVTWSAATPLRIRGCGSFVGDQALFVFDGPGPAEGFTGTELTAAEIPTLVIKGFNLNPVDLTP